MKMFSKFISEIEDGYSKDELINFLLSFFMVKTRHYNAANKSADKFSEILGVTNTETYKIKMSSDYYNRLMATFYLIYVTNKKLHIDMREYFGKSDYIAKSGYVDFMKWWANAPQGLRDLTQDNVMALKIYAYSDDEFVLSDKEVIDIEKESVKNIIT